MKHFNEFFALVKEDRASPQATAMKGKLLEFAIQNKGHILIVMVQMRWWKAEQR